MSTNVDLLRRAIPTTAGLIRGIGDDQWRATTPCEGMTVLGLVGHLVGGLRQFAGVARGESIDPTGEPELAPGDAPAEFSAAAAEMLVAWSAAGVARAAYTMPWGETPGEMLLGFMVIEEVTHGWDLARATGQEPSIDPELAEATLTLARSYDDTTIRVPGMFGPEVPIADGAPVMDRLAAFLGRQPA